MEELYDLRELDQIDGITYGELPLCGEYFASVLKIYRSVKNAFALEIRAFSIFVDQIISHPSP